MNDKALTLSRRNNMAAIKGRNTKPEMIVRQFLWSHGFRYRLNHRRLPGKPDVVLTKYRTCIFINGCFWHGHHVDFGGYSTELTAEVLEGIQNSSCCKIPHTRRDFWVKKIRRNQERDLEVQHKLAQMGWHCITVWECQLKKEAREQTLLSLCYTLNHIYLKDRSIKPYIVQEEQIDKAAESATTSITSKV